MSCRFTIFEECSLIYSDLTVFSVLMAIDVSTLFYIHFFGPYYQLLLSDQIVDLFTELSDRFKTGVFEVAPLGQCFFSNS